MAVHRLIGGLSLGIVAANAQTQETGSLRQHLVAAQSRPPAAAAVAAEIADELTAMGISAALHAALRDDQRDSMCWSSEAWLFVVFGGRDAQALNEPHE